MNDTPIPDDEILLRHIPGGEPWQTAGSRLTSVNFQLRSDQGETGISVTRLSITSPTRLLELVGGSSERGSRVARATAGDIRRLGLQVVPTPRPEDSGHCDIRSLTSSLEVRLTRRQLANLFQFLDEEDSLPGSSNPS
jgi:hypothetical protein